MIYLPLAAGVPLIMKLLSYVWGFTAILLILIILIQKGKGGGLSGAFGGAGATGLLGTKTGDFLTWVTISLVALFLGIGVVMVKFYKPVLSEDLQPPSTPRAPVDVGGRETGTLPGGTEDSRRGIVGEESSGAESGSPAGTESEPPVGSNTDSGGSSNDE